MGVVEFTSIDGSISLIEVDAENQLGQIYPPKNKWILICRKGHKRLDKELSTSS